MSGMCRGIRQGNEFVPAKNRDRKGVAMALRAAGSDESRGNGNPLLPKELWHDFRQSGAGWIINLRRSFSCEKSGWES